MLTGCKGTKSREKNKTNSFVFSSETEYLRRRRRQRYEKSRAKQKNLTFFLPRRSKFALVKRKVTKSRAQNKRNSFFFCQDGVTSPSQTAKLRKNERRTKETRLFFLPSARIRLRFAPFRSKNFALQAQSYEKGCKDYKPVS